MKKSAYIASATILAALVLPACSNDDELIFSESAADRLEAAKADYTARLAADGGKWMMEYFANGDEPGYLMGMEFSPSGAVTVTANNKWVGGTMRQETSLWQVITDDGPVLTYNSYNDLFHVFSDPADIIGGPTNPETGSDVNETGYGHDGDYEFTIMHFSEANDTVRLRGKKRGITIWMHRLPADTDMEAYQEKVTAAGAAIFSEKVPTLYLTDASGERFVVKDAASGIFSVYPEAGDAVMQTVKKNAIFTDKGIRFMNTFSIPRSDPRASHLELTSMAIQPDGSLADANGNVMTGPAPADFFVNHDRSWLLDESGLTGVFAPLVDNLRTEIPAYRSAFRYSKITFAFDKDRKQIAMTLVITGRNSRSGIIYFDATANADGTATLKFANDDNHLDQAGSAYYKNLASLRVLVDAINGSAFKMESANAMKPVTIHATSTANSADSFTVNIQ